MRAERAEPREFSARRAQLIERQTSWAVRWAACAERAERRVPCKSLLAPYSVMWITTSWAVRWEL